MREAKSKPGSPQWIADVSQAIDYQFRNPQLLIQALTRESAIRYYIIPGSIGDFQRLEFVGDRVLNLVIAERLLELYPNQNVGALNLHYQSFIANHNDKKKYGGPLYRVAKHLGLNRFIIFGGVECLENKQEFSIGKNRKNSQEGVLSDHMEALIYAIYIDSDKDLNVIRAFILKHWTYLGLNDENESISSFGETHQTVSSHKISEQQKMKLSKGLFKAACQDNWKICKILLDENNLCGSEDNEGNTILFYFIAPHNNLSAIKQLHKNYDANLNTENHNGYTPLYYAVINRYIKIVQYLLSEFVDTAKMYPDKSGNNITILEVAAGKSNIAIFKILFEEEKNFLTQPMLESIVKKALSNDPYGNEIVKFIKHYKHQKEQEKIKKIAQLQQANADLFKAITLNIKAADFKKELESNWCLGRYDVINIDKALLFRALDEGAALSAEDQYGISAFHYLLAFSYSSSGEKNIFIHAIKAYPNLSGINLANSKLGWLHTFGNIFTNLDFSHARLCHVKFSYHNLTNISFKQADLTGVNFTGCRLQRVDFTGAVLSGTTFAECSMDGVTLTSYLAEIKKQHLSVEYNLDVSGADLRHVNMQGTHFNGWTFGDHMKRAKFDTASLKCIWPQLLSQKAQYEFDDTSPFESKRLLETADISTVDFTAFDVSKINFKNVRLSKINLVSLLPRLKNNHVSIVGARIRDENLAGLDLSRTELRGVSFSKIQFSQANLTYINFEKANFYECDLTSANLTGANLTKANIDIPTLRTILLNQSASDLKYIVISSSAIEPLSYLNFSGRDLTGVDFSNTFIEHVSFAHANLSKSQFRSQLKFVDFEGANLSEATFMPNLEHTSLKNVKIDNTTLNLVVLFAIIETNKSRENFESTYHSVNPSHREIMFNNTLLDAHISWRNGPNQIKAILPLLRKRKLKIKSLHLTGENSHYLNFSQLDLSGLRLTNCIFRMVDLSGANLTDSIFSHCVFDHVKLANADLSNTIFDQECYFNPTTLKSVEINKAHFNNVYLNKERLKLFERKLGHPCDYKRKNESDAKILIKHSAIFLKNKPEVTTSHSEKSVTIKYK